MTQQDALPKRICLECRLALEKSFLFRNKSKNSDSKLRRHFRLINAGKGKYDKHRDFFCNQFCYYYIINIAESRVFHDSEDEFEDDYTESIEFITDIENKLQQKSIFYQNNAQNDDKIKQVRSETQKLFEDRSFHATFKHDKSHNMEQNPFGSSSATRTRFSNRLQNISENKNKDSSKSYELDGQIEILMEDVENDQEVEYVIADHMDDIPDDQFQSTDSNDEMSTLLVDENEFEPESIELQSITKTDEQDVSEESMDVILDCEDAGKSTEN